jgi:DNA phosphorothioation-dependent restriction protein DptG
MAENRKHFAWLKPLVSKRTKRLEQYLETESHEWMDTIERRRKDRDEKERQIDLAPGVSTLFQAAALPTSC